jgi:hypothetical protein
MTTKRSDPFAGFKLTDLTAPPSAPLDQQLFRPASPPTPSDDPRKKQNELTKRESRQGGNEGNREGKREVGRERAILFDINATPYRKDSFLFTDAEFEAMEDLKIDLRRRFDLKATKNDIARCALQHLFEDYERTGEASMVVRRLRTKGQSRQGGT